MSIHEPTGEKPGSKGRDSLSRTPNVFAVPEPLGQENPAAAHHETPVEFPAAEELDWIQITDQFPFGLIVLGPGQELRHENAVCEKLLGTTIRECGSVDAWISALCPDGEHCDQVAASFRDHVWRNQLTRTFSLKSEKGKLKEIEFRSSLQQDGGITIVLQDVTERLRAQETQRHGKLKFRALFGGTDQGAILVDRTGRIIDANASFLSLAEISLSEIRRSAFSELLHPEDAKTLARVESATIAKGGSPPPKLNVRIRGKEGEFRTPISFHPIGEKVDDPSMSLYLTGSAAGGKEAKLTERLQLVARKAKSLLDAVPDLIFLIDNDLTVADFAPPPHPWKELETLDSWRGQEVNAIWPALGELLSAPRCDMIRGGKVVHADLQSHQEGLVEFGVTLSSAGDDQILAVVRNQSALRQAKSQREQLSRAFQKIGSPSVIVDGTGTILEANAAIRNLVNDTGDELVGAPLTALLDETSCMLVAQHLPAGVEDEAEIAALQATVKRRGESSIQTNLEVCSLSRADEPVTFALFIRNEETSIEAVPGPSTEKVQHQFRNQLQMVTSLFSIETKESIEDDNFIKWQLRLRALACAIPNESGIRFGELIHQVSNEAARLMLLGPLERLIFLNGPDSLEITEEKSTPMALLLGELIRDSVYNRKPGRQPRLHFSYESVASGGLSLKFRAENTRRSTANEEAPESIKLLTSQMGGTVLPSNDESRFGWIFDIPA